MDSVTWHVAHGDCLDVMARMEPNSVDAIVTDPPAGISFMGQAWDNFGGRSNGRAQADRDAAYNRYGKGALPYGFSGSSMPARKERDTFISFMTKVFAEALRVAKPGAHALVWALPRTSHWTATALEDAGWEIREIIHHVHAQGFPKSLSVNKALKEAGKCCQCPNGAIQYTHDRSLSSLPEATTEDAAESSAPVLLTDVCGDSQAHAANGQGVPSMRSGMAAPDAVSGSEGQDLFASLRGETIAAHSPYPEEAATLGNMSPLRTRVSASEWSQDRYLLQPVVPSQGDSGEPAPPRQPRQSELDRSQSSLLSSEDERPQQSGVEGRRHLQAKQGQLHRPEVCPLPAGVPDDGTGGRLRDGASPCDGAVGRTATDADGGGAPPRPSDAAQRAREPGAMAGQSEPQGGGRWPLCPRCGLPVIDPGLGTALKPAVENWILCRKPLAASTVAGNVLAHGTGAVNIDECRVQTSDNLNGGVYSGGTPKSMFAGLGRLQPEAYRQPTGRWPSNLVLSHSAACVRVGTRRVTSTRAKSRGGATFGGSQPYRYADGMVLGYADPDGTEQVDAWDCAEGCPVQALDEQTGERPSSGQASGLFGIGSVRQQTYWDCGSASRFFPTFHDADPSPTDGLAFPGIYQPKASRRERNAGLEGMPLLPARRNGEQGQGPLPQQTPRTESLQYNTHPTVKSVALMAWLCRLITPPGGTILDMFAGSGSTGCAAVQEGFSFIGIDAEEAYVAIARARIAHWAATRPAQAALALD